LFTQVDHQLFGARATVRMIAVRDKHSMAITLTAAGDTLWTWGNNDSGQLGHGDNGTNRLVPVAIPAATFDGVAVVSMDGGVDHILVVTADGSLWGCGHDGYGELGLDRDYTGGTPEVFTLQRVATNLSGIPAVMGFTRSLTLIDPALFACKKIIVVAAEMNSCGAVTEDGEVMLWGGAIMSTPILHARICRWHNLRLEHTLAFTMMFHERLGATADGLTAARVFPPDLLELMFNNMHLQPHANTLDGLRDMMGRQPPRRVVALDHDDLVLLDGDDEE